MVGADVVGIDVVGLSVVGSDVVGIDVVGLDVVGTAVVGDKVVGDVGLVGDVGFGVGKSVTCIFSHLLDPGPSSMQFSISLATSHVD